MPLTLPNAPPAVVTALERLTDDLTRTAGLNLAGLILYGGVARGRYRPGKSDVNVVVLLREMSGTALSAIGPALRTARRAVGIVPMILTPAEVPATALVFPTKFLDIQEHHVVLSGEDPFASLAIPRERLSWRIAQELRNLALRLRQRFVATLNDPAAQAASLAAMTRPLALQAAALLRLAGNPVPSEDHSSDVFQTAGPVFGLDGEALGALVALRRGATVVHELPDLFGRVLAVLARLTEVAEELKEVPR
jgi:hypothetical protein